MGGKNPRIESPEGVAPRLRPWMELVTHELRNPLSSVKMAVQTLQRNNALSERDRRRLFIANREIRSLERLLWLLSECGREAVPEIEGRSLRGLLEETLPLISPELEERQIRVEVTSGGDASAQLDGKRLRPALAQLLLNLASAQPPGAVIEVRIGNTETRSFLELTCDWEAREEEEPDKLLEPFGSRLVKGAGLSGLALQQVVKSAGGEVTVEGPGGKLIFRLSFVP